jgi:hypothetical protein
MITVDDLRRHESGRSRPGQSLTNPICPFSTFSQATGPSPRHPAPRKFRDEPRVGGNQAFIPESQAPASLSSSLRCLWQARGGDVLGVLEPGTGGLIGDRGGKSERTFLDFQVGEDRLGPLVAARAGIVDLANDYVSVLVTNWSAAFRDAAVRQLLGDITSPLPDGRVPLYVCAECGGLGCGTVTAVIGRVGDQVVWRRLGRQTDYDSFVDYELFDDLRPFRFRASRYDSVLRGLLADNAQPTEPGSPAGGLG